MRALRAIDASVLTGVFLGFGGVFLVYMGNPANSGICVSCFLENVAGALQLHDYIRMSYLRPELLAFVLGSFIVATGTKRFRATGGSSPMVQFFIGFFIIAGCAVFIGCPIKMFLRLAAGDLTAVAATVGLVVGIWVGVIYVKKGFSLDQRRPVSKISGYFVPAISAVLLLLLFINPSFIAMGQKGPAAWKAPIPIALGLGLLIGGFAQRSGLCVTGGIRNLFLAREKTLFKGLMTAVGVAFVASLIFGQFNLGMKAQPASHLSHGWTFLAMLLVGFGSVLIDGCPFRQLIKAGQGDVDAAVATLGMLTGGALAYSWLLRSTSAGPTFQGKVIVMAGLVFSILVATAFRKRRQV